MPTRKENRMLIQLRNSPAFNIKDGTFHTNFFSSAGEECTKKYKIHLDLGTPGHFAFH